MVSVFDVDSVGELIRLVVWGLAVAGVQWAVFGSFWAGELTTWMKAWQAPTTNEMGRIRWENQHRMRWQPQYRDLKPDDLRATAEKMSAADVEFNRKRYAALMRRSLPWRAAQYFLGCVGCQTFFSSLGVFAVTGWPGFVPAILTAILYAGIAARGIPVVTKKPGVAGGCGK